MTVILILAFALGFLIGNSLISKAEKMKKRTDRKEFEDRLNKLIKYQREEPG